MTGSQKAPTDPCRWQLHAGETRKRGATLRNSSRANTPLVSAPEDAHGRPGPTPRGKQCLRGGATTPGFARASGRAPYGQVNLRLQPLGPKPKVPGAHLSQVLPTTFGRHWHWPPLGSQTELNEPCGSHSQAAGENEVTTWDTAAAPPTKEGSLSPPAPARPVPSLGLSLVLPP